MCVFFTGCAKRFYVIGEKYIRTSDCHIFRKELICKMRRRNEGRIKEDFEQMLLHMCRLYVCGRVAVSCECGISDRLCKTSVIYWLTVQLLVSKKLRGFSPRENYTDRAAAAGRRS